MGAVSAAATSAALFSQAEQALLEKILSAIGLSAQNCLQGVLCQATGHINLPALQVNGSSVESAAVIEDRAAGSHLGQSYSPPTSFSDCLAERNLVLVIFLLNGDAADGVFVQRAVERLGHHSAQLALSFHPNTLLRSPALKADTWASLRRLKPWLSQQVTGADFANQAP